MSLRDGGIVTNNLLPGPTFSQHGDLSGHATADGWAGVRLGPWLVLVRLTAGLAEVLRRAGTASARPSQQAPHRALSI